MSPTHKDLQLIRVFISSPSDVPEERAFVRTAIQRLAREFRDDWQVLLEAVAWDAPESNTVMHAAMTPQEAINQGLARPSECDLTVVILWSRIGTPLPPEYSKPGGERFESGTEWEYLDAMNAKQSRPDQSDVIVYRRTEPPTFAATDLEIESKREQWRKVEVFFRQFRNADGSLRGGVNEYRSMEEFRDRFPDHLRRSLRRLLTPKPRPPEPAPPPPPVIREPKPQLTRLTPIVHFPIAVPAHGFCIPETGGRLWVCTGLRVHVHHLRQSTNVAAFDLPNRRWKSFLKTIWHDGLLAADWDGALYHLNHLTSSRAASSPFYAPAWDDTPIHLLAATDDGTLWGASWNGRLRRWGADGALRQMSQSPVTPALPTHLLALPQEACVVADQAGGLTVFDAQGAVRWKWRSELPIRAIRAETLRAPYRYLVWVGDRHVIQLSEGQPHAHPVEFAAPLQHIAEHPSGKSDRWYAVALAQGRIEWLSTSHPTIDAASRVTLAEPLKQLCPFSVAGHEESLTLCGLTGSGGLFSVAGQEVRHYGDDDRPVTAEALLIDPTGRFLFLLQPQAIEAFRNPAAPAVACQVELVRPVTGTVVRDVYSRLVLTVRNPGPFAVHALRATLQADGVEHPFRTVNTPRLPFLPGSTMELEFSVRSPSLGLWPLLLRLEVMDEGGPPETCMDRQLTVESLPS